MHNSKYIILFSFVFEIIIIFHDLMIRENNFIYTHIFFLNLFSTRNECIFVIEIYSLVI